MNINTKLSIIIFLEILITAIVTFKAFFYEPGWLYLLVVVIGIVIIFFTLLGFYLRGRKGGFTPPKKFLGINK